MGFLDNIFGREPKEKTIKSIELKEWLEEIAPEVLEEFNKDIKEIYSDIEKTKAELHEKIDVLEDAELVNKNIPDREIHIMEGNRENYIKRTYHFIEDLRLPEQHYDEIEEFCKDFTNLLDKFNKNTGKAYYVLKNFYNKEMQDIASQLKNIETYVDELQEIVQSKSIKQYQNLFIEIRKLNEAIVESDKLTHEINSVKGEMEETKRKKDHLKEKMSELKESDDFSQFNKIEKERKEVDEETSKLNERILSKFKGIERYLKKEAHGTKKEEFVNTYIRNPLESVEDDANLDIVDVLQRLRKSLRDIELKKKEEDKIKKVIDGLDKKHLTSVQEKIGKLKKKKSKLNEKVKKKTVMVDYKDYEYRIEHAEEKIERLEGEIKVKKAMFEDLKLSNKIERLEVQLSEFSGYEVEIVA